MGKPQLFKSSVPLSGGPSVAKPAWRDIVWPCAGGSLSPRWLHLMVWFLLAPQGRHQPTFTTSGAGGGPCSQLLPLLSCCEMVPCYAGVPRVLLCSPFWGSAASPICDAIPSRCHPPVGILVSSTGR